jgi:hypothetical protein
MRNKEWGCFRRRTPLHKPTLRRPYSLVGAGCALFRLSLPPLAEARGSGAPKGAQTAALLRDTARTLRSVRSPRGAPLAAFSLRRRAALFVRDFTGACTSAARPSASSWRGAYVTPRRSPGAARCTACEAMQRAPHRPKTGISPVPATGTGTVSPMPTPGSSRRCDASRMAPLSGRGMENIVYNKEYCQ